MKIECPIDLLFADRDGEGTPAERKIVQEHLALCLGCQTLVKELEEQSQILSPFREARAPRGFADRVMARVESVGPVSRPFGWKSLGFKTALPRWVWAGAAALSLGVALWSPRTTVTRPRVDPEVSVYLADTRSVEEQADLGTEIENYFL